MAPKSRTRSTPHAPPSRASAAPSAGSASKALWPSSGGGWLRTSCVKSAARGVTAMAGLLRGVDRGETELNERGDQRLVAAEAARRRGRQRAHQRLADGADEAGGDGLDVLLGQLAGGDPLSQQPREHVAVAATQGEALGLDGRVHRLGDL